MAFTIGVETVQSLYLQQLEISGKKSSRAQGKIPFYNIIFSCKIPPSPCSRLYVFGYALFIDKNNTDVASNSPLMTLLWKKKSILLPM